jgi:hypothetical protein
VLSEQSILPSHTKFLGIQAPFRHEVSLLKLQSKQKKLEIN